MFSALRNRDYRLYWTGAMISFTGSWIQNICHGWLVYEITGSKFWFGFIGFVGSVPLFAFSFFGGAIADKVDKRRALVLTQSLFVILTFVLGMLVSTGHVNRYNVALIAFLSGVVMAIDAPMRQSIPIQIVGKKDLSNAIAFNSVAFNLARISGPALVAFILPPLSKLIGREHAMAWCFYANSLSYVAVIIALLMMRVQTPPANGDSQSMLRDLRAGFSYVRSERRIAALISMTVVSSLFVMTYPSLVLMMSKDIMGAGIGGYGTLMTSTGIGALMGATTLAWRSSKGKRGIVLLGAVLLDGLMLLLVASSHDMHLMRLLMAGVGYMTVTFNAMTNTLIQSLSNDHFRGRVVSVYVFAGMGLSPFASLQAGALAERFGAPAALSLGGFLFAAMGLYVFLLRKDIRTL